MVEGGLRLAGLPGAPELVWRFQFEGKHYAALRERYFNRFLRTPRRANMETPPDVVVRSAPGEEVFRIVVLGGSAAYGWHFPEYSFPRILEHMLRARYPDRAFEVINAAYHGMNSHVMWRVAGACAALQPDLYVVYLGNNEFIGPFGLQSTLGRRGFSLHTLDLLISANMKSANWRLLRVFRDAALALNGAEGMLDWGRKRPLLDINDRRVDRVYAHYAWNLGRICRAGRRHGADVVLCTVAANIRDAWPAQTPPATLPDTQAAFLRAEGKGEEALAAGHFEEAAACYTEAIALRPEHARAHFQLASAHWELGQFGAAKKHFQQALANDLALTRATPRINSAVRETAQRYPNARLADCAGAIAAASAQGVPGGECFYDDCHLTFRGNYAAAAAVCKQVDALLFPNADGAARRALPDIGAMRLRLGYSKAVECKALERSIEVLETLVGQFGFARFKGRLERLKQNRAQFRAGIAGREKQLRAEGFRRALEAAPDSLRVRERYIHALIGLGKTGAAIREGRRLVAQCPPWWRGNRAYGDALRAAQRGLDAGRHLDRLYPLYNGYWLFQLRRAEYYLSGGALEKGETSSRKLAEFRPESSLAWYLLGESLYGQGKTDLAIQAFARAHTLAPEDPTVGYRYAAVLYETGQVAHAREVAQKLIAIDPSDLQPFPYISEHAQTPGATVLLYALNSVNAATHAGLCGLDIEIAGTREELRAVLQAHLARGAPFWLAIRQEPRIAPTETAAEIRAVLRAAGWQANRHQAKAINEWMLFHCIPQSG